MAGRNFAHSGLDRVDESSENYISAEGTGERSKRSRKVLNIVDSVPNIGSAWLHPRLEDLVSPEDHSL